MWIPLKVIISKAVQNATIVTIHILMVQFTHARSLQVHVCIHNVVINGSQSKVGEEGKGRTIVFAEKGGKSIKARYYEAKEAIKDGLEVSTDALDLFAIFVSPTTFLLFLATFFIHEALSRTIFARTNKNH